MANPFTGKQEVTILHGGWWGDQPRPRVKDTAVVDYTLKFDPNNVVLKMDVDFAPKGLDKERMASVGAEPGVQGWRSERPGAVAGSACSCRRWATLSNAFDQLTGSNTRSLRSLSSIRRSASAKTRWTARSG